MYFPICIIFSKFFSHVWVSAVISSAFSQILTMIFKSGLVHLVTKPNALIFSTFVYTLAALLRSSLLHLVIETNALRFSSYIPYYSKTLNISLPLLFAVFCKIQDSIILNSCVFSCQLKFYIQHHNEQVKNKGLH